MEIDESGKDIVIWLGQPTCIRFRISNEFRIFKIGIEGFCVDRLDFWSLIVCRAVRLWFDGIHSYATTEKWSEIKSEVDTERTLHPV